MTILKLISTIDDYEVKDGLAHRRHVKEAYGAGFEGAVNHATAEGFVFMDPAGNGLGLTVRARSLLKGRTDAVGPRRT